MALTPYSETYSDIVNEPNARLTEFKNNLQQEMKHRLFLLKRQIDAEIRECEERKRQLQIQGRGLLGVFQKKRIRDEIYILDRRIELLQNPAHVIHNGTKMKELAKNALKAYAEAAQCAGTPCPPIPDAAQVFQTTSL